MENDQVGGSITIIRTESSTAENLSSAMGLSSGEFQARVWVGIIIGFALAAYVFYIVVQSIFGAVKGDARMTRSSNGINRGARERDEDTFRELRKSRQKAD